MVIDPFSLTGLLVLAIFLIGMTLIVFEAQLEMDKFKPAMFMMSGLIVIGLHYALTDPNGFQYFLHAQSETKEELFGLIAFMAFMWMVVELLNERNVFTALNGYLLRKGLGARGMFWATGALSATLSPFLNNFTTAMIFGKTITSISSHPRYTHVALCNIVVASNSGVWFLGTSTSLMVVLAGKISIAGLLLLIPSALIGWLLFAATLQLFYLNKLDGQQLIRKVDASESRLKPGGAGLALVGFIAVIGAVLCNIVLKVGIEFAIGIGLGLVALYSWLLTRLGIETRWHEQLQKVEWNALLFFIGIITSVACLNHVGWLSYISRLFELLDPTLVNVVLGVASGVMDNVPVEAAALMSNPNLGLDQWALNALMVGIGGSLTVVGSAAGVMAMTLDKSYSFGVHLKFLPAILVNFLGSLGIWYLQFQWLGLGG
ncbi:sodium:proton antiporter NhaD [Ectopseudomonas hydrolytica]|jgi:Na+/H+ antiporter NhaD/arsenite permease-like protein|uniref:Sodium/proton antiporter, NhaD family n=2 Tax=Ectopseudomonas TaxID=3236654 RepID=A4XVX9_ECTM1|nr:MULTISPECIES: sodium:proton antiporter NhaD [Pseudomonas]ATH82565.1 citrate transporter [Pseudomonas mendocina]EJO93976.1 citrate transporter [Pseudomonas mendocina DLHK]MBA4245520.1 citrate transporter [Pseudomonas sp.]MDH0095974.1 sodium:proton antiporter NhaD [Pseudomonas sp. GD04158]USR41650.1 sodium:proton antiporter NhaD [Pseudomonas hydrolytica]